MNRCWRWVWVLAAACGPAPEPGPQFVAQAADFAGASGWSRFDFAATDGTSSVHTSFPRVVFINRLPPMGSKSFPTGTIIVKELNDMSQTFAMVKRGGDFNRDGATGWEWFELSAGTDTPAIVWRGVSPPPSSSYAGNNTTTCNDCHQGARSNDFVQAQALSLSKI